MSFWDFSNKIYQPDSVRESCLKLQNNHGLDVNMVLFCYWYGITYGSINQDLFIQCHDFSRTWSKNAVKPLRNVRTWLKHSGCAYTAIDNSSCMEYRETVKQVELQAEKLQQLSLEGLCTSYSQTASGKDNNTMAIANNLKLYLHTGEISVTDPIICEFENLANHAINDFDHRLFKQIINGSDINPA